MNKSKQLLNRMSHKGFIIIYHLDSVLFYSGNTKQIQLSIVG
jgi:hypothetical protein